jgi:hypothetical protein
MKHCTRCLEHCFSFSGLLTMAQGGSAQDLVFRVVLIHHVLKHHLPTIRGLKGEGPTRSICL